MSRKVAVIGLDCAAPQLVFDRYQADMPNLRRLRDAGTGGPRRGVYPPITVPAWTCMMTGRDPGELGIYGFRNRADHGYDKLQIAFSSWLRERTVWDRLGEAGYRV